MVNTVETVEPLVTMKTAAASVGVSPSMLRRLVAQRRIPHVRVAGEIVRVRLSQVLSVFEEISPAA